MERATNNHPENRPSLLELHAGLINAYGSRLDFLEAIRWADKGDSPYPEFADAWELLANDQREMVKSKLGLWEDQLAIALARTGDFGVARQLMSRPGFLTEKVTDRLSHEKVDWCLKLAGIEIAHGVNPENTFRKALQAARKQAARYKEHGSGIDSISIDNFIRIAETLYQNGNDYQGVLAEIVRMVEKEAPKHSGGYAHHYDAVAEAFAFCGLFNQANELIQKGTRAGQSKVLLAIALKQVSGGDIDGAIKIAKNSRSDIILAQVLAQSALFCAQRKTDNSQLVIQAQEVIERLDDRHITQKAGLYLLLAKAAHQNSQPFNNYFNKVFALSLTEDDLVTRVDLLIMLAKAQAELDGSHKPTFMQLLETVEHLYVNANKDDKIDNIESLMVGEDTTGAAIDLSLFDEAKRLIQHLLVRGQVAWEGTELSFVAKFYARIAMGQAKLGLREDELMSISQSEIDRLIRSNDHRLLEALGYFCLVDEKTLKGLGPDRTVSISLGRAKRAGIKNEDLDSLEQVYRGAENSRVTRAIIEGISDQRPEDAAERLHALLDSELQGSRNHKIITRLIKGLIEMGDDVVFEIATLLFMDETFPAHLRLYLAKKLCDSGHWDRQIVFYFQNYRAQGRNIQNFAIDVQIDSLAAIIKQMHLTPNLAVYKILEKTRLKRDKEGLAQLANFGARIFLLPDLNLEEKINIFSFWAEKFEGGGIDSSELEVLIGNMSLFSRAKSGYLVRNNLDDRAKSVKDNVKSLLTSPLLLDHFAEISHLLKNGIFPTRALVKFTRQNGLSSIGRLDLLRHETKNGQFDPANKLQRDLEFTRYLLLSGAGPKEAYHQFAELEFIPPSDETLRRLNPKEMLEAEAAAYEAANLYWFIRQRVEEGRKVTVIGNQRYGDYFVTEPLRADLEELGVQVCFFKVGSTGAGKDTVADIFPDSFTESFIAEAPDIVIVDGTKTPHDDRGIPRFPKSMGGYLNWFTAFNEAAGSIVPDRNRLRNSAGYKKLVAKIVSLSPQKPYAFSHWLPKGAKKVNLGEETVTYREPTFDQPNVIFANPVINPKATDGFPKMLSGHQPGALDDPDQLVKGEKIIAMTPTGVKQIIKGHGDEAQFVNSIQLHMSSVLPEYIRETDPASKR